MDQPFQGARVVGPSAGRGPMCRALPHSFRMHRCFKKRRRWADIGLTTLPLSEVIPRRNNTIRTTSPLISGAPLDRRETMTMIVGSEEAALARPAGPTAPPPDRPYGASEPPAAPADRPRPKGCLDCIVARLRGHCQSGPRGVMRSSERNRHRSGGSLYGRVHCLSVSR